MKGSALSCARGSVFQRIIHTHDFLPAGISAKMTMTSQSTTLLIFTFCADSVTLSLSHFPSQSFPRYWVCVCVCVCSLMMASNDPLKPVPGAELSPEPSAMSKEAPTSTADETDVDMSSPTPTNAAMSETSPLSGGAAYTASGSPSKSKPSPLKSFKQKLPEVVTELKKQNERLTKENANVEGVRFRTLLFRLCFVSRPFARP